MRDDLDTPALDVQIGGRMSRIAASLFGAAGVMALVANALYTFYEPSYYDASAWGDYLSVGILSAAFVTTGLALAVLWRDPPVKRGSLFLLLAGIAATAEGLGLLLEDSFGVEDAVWGFFLGGLTQPLFLVIAGIAALTVRCPQRWSGVFLLSGSFGGWLGFGFLMMGVSWILFGLWIVYEHRAYVMAIILAALPAAATAFYLYADDFNLSG